MGDSFFSNASGQKKEIAPEELNLPKDVDRPHEENTDELKLEYEIDHKRKIVMMEGKLRAEREKNHKNQLLNVGSMGRKGGIPNMRLKGLTDPDFFQKNTTLEKGWTFNYDGSIVDFKKPKNQRELDEKVGYEVGQETVIKDA